MLIVGGFSIGLSIFILWPLIRQHINVDALTWESLAKDEMFYDERDDH
jgi:hypothetical protein